MVMGWRRSGGVVPQGVPHSEFKCEPLSPWPPLVGTVRQSAATDRWRGAGFLCSNSWYVPEPAGRRTEPTTATAEQHSHFAHYTQWKHLSVCQSINRRGQIRFTTIAVLTYTLVLPRLRLNVVYFSGRLSRIVGKNIESGFFFLLIIIRCTIEISIITFYCTRLSFSFYINICLFNCCRVIGFWEDIFLTSFAQRSNDII